MRDSSHRTIKKMQFLRDERCTLHIYCYRVENLLYLSENLCLPTLERGETATAYCVARKPIDDYAKDGGEELFTKMHCVLVTNP